MRSSVSFWVALSAQLRRSRARIFVLASPESGACEPSAGIHNGTLRTIVHRHDGRQWELRDAYKTVEPPVVYESNAGGIGLLSGEEVEALVAFYTDLYWLRDQQDIEDRKDRVREIVERRQRAITLLRDAR